MFLQVLRLIDINLIVRQLAVYDFSAYDVKALPARDVIIAVPDGDWFLESPFSSVYRNDNGDQLLLTNISLGFHSLFQYSSGLRFDIYITENDCVVVQHFSL